MPGAGSRESPACEGAKSACTAIHRPHRVTRGAGIRLRHGSWISPARSAHAVLPPPQPALPPALSGHRPERTVRQGPSQTRRGAAACESRLQAAKGGSAGPGGATPYLSSRQTGAARTLRPPLGARRRRGARPGVRRTVCAQGTRRSPAPCKRGARAQKGQGVSGHQPAAGGTRGDALRGCRRLDSGACKPAALSSQRPGPQRRAERKPGPQGLQHPPQVPESAAAWPAQGGGRALYCSAQGSRD